MEVYMKSIEFGSITLILVETIILDGREKGNYEIY